MIFIFLFFHTSQLALVALSLSSCLTGIHSQAPSVTSGPLADNALFGSQK